MFGLDFGASREPLKEREGHSDPVCASERSLSCSPHAWPCPKCLPVLTHLILTETLGGRHFYYRHVAEEDIKVQRNYVTYLRSHSQKVAVGTLTFIVQMRKLKLRKVHRLAPVTSKWLIRVGVRVRIRADSLTHPARFWSQLWK